MEALGINAGFLIGQLVNFSLFAILMYLFAWKPLLAFLDARSEKIAQGLENARIAEEARGKAEEEAQKIIANARNEAQKITAEARASAEERAKPLIEAAQQDADKIRADAASRAEEARNSALAGVRGQVVTLAVAAANQVIGDALADKKRAEKVVTDFFTTSQVDMKNLGDNLVVTTALPLEAAEKDSIAKTLGGTVAEWKVDPSILGGVVVRAGDKVVDGSVRSRLGALAGSLN